MPNDIKKLRRLMKAAHAIKSSNPAIFRGAKVSASYALKYAWWFENFRDKLRSGIWRFSYFKKDGTIREAKGTLNPNLIPVEFHPKGNSDAREAFDTFPYFDLEANGWRSFRLDNFIGFVEPVGVPCASTPSGPTTAPSN